jgi:hypothetical protein
MHWKVVSNSLFVVECTLQYPLTHDHFYIRQVHAIQQSKVHKATAIFMTQLLLIPPAAFVSGLKGLKSIYFQAVSGYLYYIWITSCRLA